MKRLIHALSILVLFVIPYHGKADSPEEELRLSRKNIGTCWRFSLEDLHDASSYDFDDSSWRQLDLPHDWAFENGYAPDGAQGDKGGYACGGVGWYRKHLHIDNRDIAGKKAYLDFDAVYMNSEVWINGHYLGKRPYGYISFSYDISEYTVPGDNVISVRVDNSLEPSARWYHGCGIYGNVYFRTENTFHFVKDGIFVRPGLNDDGTAGIDISYKLSNDVLSGHVSAYISGKAEKSGPAAGGSGDIRIVIDKPVLWSPETPYLYELKLVLHNRDGSISDAETIRFGIRDISWDAEKGFFLNGKQTKLKGVCEHLEGGPVGAAWTESLMKWKLRLLKDMGCNAIRTAHNPQLPMFYDLCDELGIMVMDEAFDGWKQKAAHDYGKQAFDEWWERDLRTMIRRDRNHPCVIIYSVGNETKGEIGKELVRICHEEDPTRLVTSGHSAPEAMDILGINGHSEKKGFLLTYTPGDKAFIGTETPHTWQVRGFYRTKTWYRDGFPNKGQDPFEIPDLTEKELFGYDWTSPDRRRNIKQVFNSSYDNATVRLTARHNIQFLRDKDWYSGHFRWTGFDYLGEAGYVHGGWPFRAFQGGVLDLAGFPKDHYYLYRSQWSEKDMIHILPHWTHPDMAYGEKIPVWCYTSGDEAELLLNGISLGKKRKGTEWNEMQCEWSVPWTPGTLTAIAYRNGKEICRSVRKTSGSPSFIGIDTEKLSDGTVIATFSQTDTYGTPFPYGDNRIYISLTGNAKVISFENGNPTDTECNAGALSRRTFFGLARAFIKTGDKNAGMIAAAISGDRTLKTSHKVSVPAYRIALAGQTRQSSESLTVRYTTDGSTPETGSPEYTVPFDVSSGTTVKANVYDKGKAVLCMEETFGDGNGLYWGSPGEPVCKSSGLQAEYAELSNASIHNNDGDDVYGGGYVLIKSTGGSITWYQENDGSDMDARLRIRYSHNNGNNLYMEVNNNGQSTGILEFKNTGSRAGDWEYLEIPIKLYSGANNISLISHDTASPSIDEIQIITH